MERGAELMQPLAIVVIGGLITSTFLSLLVIPVVYTFVDDLIGWGRRVLRPAQHASGSSASS
jgi:Cu/Ag efflux pump CusA